MDSNAGGGRRNKKKRRSFIQTAKRFGKSGRFGRGREIDRDTYDYFVRVMENLRDGQFDDEEAEGLFVSNVFAQTEGEEVRLCGNQLVSRVVERLLPKSSAQVKERFMTALAKDLRLTACDPFASHVLERLMVMSVFEEVKEEEGEAGFKQFSSTWAERTCRFASNNALEFCEDAYASHVLRTAFQCLSGARLPEDALRSKRFLAQGQEHGGGLGGGPKKKGKDTEGRRFEAETSEGKVAALTNAADRIMEAENKQG